MEIPNEYNELIGQIENQVVTFLQTPLSLADNSKSIIILEGPNKSGKSYFLRNWLLNYQLKVNRLIF